MLLLAVYTHKIKGGKEQMGNFVKMGFNDGGPIFPHSKKKLFCMCTGNGGVGGAIKPSLSPFHVRIASGGEEDYYTTYTTLSTSTGECHNKNRPPLRLPSRTINADILLFLFALQAYV